MFDTLIKTEFFLRRADHKQPRTLIAGLMHSIDVPENASECQMVLGHLIMVPSRRFIMPEHTRGWQMEDLLMESWSINQLEEIAI